LLKAPHAGPLLADAQGCPLWPAGVVGSISHSPSTAVAAVARAAQVRALGLDIESPHRDVGVDALMRVFDPDEIRWLARQPHQDRRVLAYALFSAREALFKCVYQASAHRLAPGEVRIEMDVEQGFFQAHWLGLSRALGLPPLVGRVGCDTQHVFAGVWC